LFSSIAVVLFRGGKFMEGVPGVTLFTTQPKLSAIQKKIQKMCKWTKGRVDFIHGCVIKSVFSSVADPCL
jgi:hypothetical protein